MSDIYIPGVKSRFETDKLIEGLMRVERIPKERTEKNVESLEIQKTYWQEIGRRINSLRESARQLFSFQNPFSERIGVSSDDLVISAVPTRDAGERKYSFTVKQLAQADRFLSLPLEDSFKVEAGTYTFNVGEDTVSFPFKGGSLKEFTDILNRRGRDKVGASIIAVEKGAKSLLIESKITGADKHLSFADDAEKLAIITGIADRVDNARRDFPLSEDSVKPVSDIQYLTFKGEVLQVAAGGAASIPFDPPVRSIPSLAIQFETAAEILPDNYEVPLPPPGPDIPPPDSVSYGGITIENEPSSVPPPSRETPERPRRVDDLAVLSLVFSDGARITLPPLTDSRNFSSAQHNLEEFTGGRAIVSLDLVNRNTHRDISIRNVRVLDPNAQGGFKARNAVSTAQDAVITMEGIEIKRPTNSIDDLIPGVTVTPKGISSRPVTVAIEPNREAIKESIIGLVGNYNRLMAEVNVLTRNDAQIIEELSYLDPDEREELKKRMGAFNGDTTLNQFKTSLQRAATMPYETAESQDLVLLAQIGIGTDVRRSGIGGSYDPSRLRGYLEIDERVLDAALETQLSGVQQLFGYDTNGDLIVDSGLAYAMDNLAKPYVESGGFVALKTGTIDSRISQDRRRIETMERQLAAKEAQLKLQYGQMEGAYNRMERMGASLDNFVQQNSNNNNR
ncbi:MAG: flagellar filament capping protein FliD [Treponema sp.]|jgi:flagellar hook-associated protein 2|nr:flagellar filament capping protein FliD [Treponema sp.]